MTLSATLTLALMAISILIGIASGWIGAYIGTKVAIARLETWRDISDNNLSELQTKVAYHGEDLLVHDFEINELMRKNGLERAMRQRLRG